MTTKYHISVGTTFRIIRDIIHARCRKKRPIHRLYPAITEKSRSRAWCMYRRLSNDKYKNYLTDDEASMRVKALEIYIMSEAPNYHQKFKKLNKMIYIL